MRLSQLLLSCCIVVSCTDYEMTDADLELQKRLSSQTLTNKLATININKNGSFDGTVGIKRDYTVSGTWNVRDGAWCRTLKQAVKGVPKQQCQSVKFLSNNLVEIDGVKPDGRKPVVYKLK